MPIETPQAIAWAKAQKDQYGNPITTEMLVDYVRQYFNDNNISYSPNESRIE